MSELTSSQASSKSIEYVIFDMDGLLIDSERIYTDVTNNILKEYGKEMTWDIKAGLMGKPEREAAEHLLSFFPGIPLTIDTYLRERDAQQDLLWPDVPILPGALRLVKHLKACSIPIALATGSRKAKFELKTSKLAELFDCFDGRIVCGDNVKIQGRGKPAPDIFLLAARDLLGIPVGTEEKGDSKEWEWRKKGLVFEDAIPGVQAGKRAGMNVAWVPDQNLLEVEYSGTHKADAIYRTLEDFKPEDWGLPPFPLTS